MPDIGGAHQPGTSSSGKTRRSAGNIGGLQPGQTPKQVQDWPNVNIPNPFKSIEDFLGYLTDPHTWLRVFEGIGGIILLVIGLKTLSGNTTTPMDVARRVARTVPVAKVAAA